MDEVNLSICGVEQPKRIWLMAYSHAGDICWTTDPNPEDADEIEVVEYVRADTRPALVTGQPEEQGVGAWRPIADAPESPMAVLLYVPAEAFEDTEAGRDYRIQIGFWTGETFCEQGTSHDYRERVEDCQPTYWKPLGDPPAQRTQP